MYLPAESKPRECWLTRSEAARLLAAALGFDATGKRVVPAEYHLALFILLGHLHWPPQGSDHVAAVAPGGSSNLAGLTSHRPGQAETKKRRGRLPGYPEAAAAPAARLEVRLGGVGPVIFMGWKAGCTTSSETFNTGAQGPGSRRCFAAHP